MLVTFVYFQLSHIKCIYTFHQIHQLIVYTTKSIARYLCDRILCKIAFKNWFESHTKKKKIHRFVTWECKMLLILLRIKLIWPNWHGQYVPTFSYDQIGATSVDQSNRYVFFSFFFLFNKFCLTKEVKILTIIIIIK